MLSNMLQPRREMIPQPAHSQLAFYGPVWSQLMLKSNCSVDATNPATGYTCKYDSNGKLNQPVVGACDLNQPPAPSSKNHFSFIK
jgi:hypothetical protein